MLRTTQMIGLTSSKSGITSSLFLNWVRLISVSVLSFQMRRAGFPTRLLDSALLLPTTATQRQRCHAAAADAIVSPQKIDMSTPQPVQSELWIQLRRIAR